ncbi:type IV toxin-antitoxin system AbiEi family antitoxin [Solitalea lacus]|uniref:type IV toxin-antitoxin system AbiEi family antitoxin n=1 Tax=Solitalea lacus TaxID=2911172 RepID=UPI001EDA4BF4|nr:type IV toxin-antitoxin system AbiEi family antitoxin [Solitalea lacus]UKJ06859.1 hypothetical protein L2B55_15165 [Solitalea lacus]
MKGGETLQTAIRNFNSITGIMIKENKDKKGNTVATINNGLKAWTFEVLIKNEIRDIHLPSILAELGTAVKARLLVCQYIPKPVKEKLKNLNINYLDAAGNCFIKQAELFFYITDQAVTPFRKMEQGKIWKQAGVKFLFGVLLYPELLNKPYRQIAELTNVSLGNIGPFIEELKEEGFIINGKNNGNDWLYLEHKERLQKRWIEAYCTTLRPKLLKGNFRFLRNEDRNNWKNLPIDQFYWGGEAAGALFTNYLQPELFTIYTKLPDTTIMRNLRLVPDKGGEIELVEPFWNDALLLQLGIPPTIVPPLLAYTELITSIDSRNQETAARIKQQYHEQF